MVLKEIRSFRLGYTLERPYPWRWTTPIVVSVFLLLSAVLAVINVPLSAVDNVQQLTYRPNDTLPRLPLANLVPSILHSQTASFAPQVLTVGDTIVLNGSTFNYTIVDAFDGVDSTPVSSFSYYNNPFSDGCDVEHMTVNLVRQMKNFSGPVLWSTNVSFSGTVVCHVPTQFHLTWSALYDPGRALLDNPLLTHTAPPENIADIPANFAFDFNRVLATWKGPTLPPDPDPALPQKPASGAIISLTALPCCDCDAVLARTPFETASLLRPPCSSTPPGFILMNGGITLDDGATSSSWSPGEITAPTTVADFFLSIQTLLGNMSPGSLDTPVSLSGLDAMWQNLFQAVYHLVRLDLGVIVENQIYNSPEMYNQTILGVPSDVASAANSSRESTSNATLSAKWQKRVEFLQNSDRVPVMEYLRPVPRMKPLGSAITSVFVSTFAMLSAIWTVFSLIAGALARRRTDTKTILDANFGGTTKAYGSGKPDSDSDDASEITHLACQQEADPARQTPLDRLRLDMEKMMDKKIARIRLSLKRHGLAEETTSDDEMTIDLHAGPRNANHPNGIFGSLVHRTGTKSGSDLLV